MYLIFYNKEKAEEAVSLINQKEGLTKDNRTKTMTSILGHPNKEKYAVPVSHLTHRSYLSELFAQERVEELSEDWFEEEVT